MLITKPNFKRMRLHFTMKLEIFSENYDLYAWS